MAMAMDMAITGTAVIIIAAAMAVATVTRVMAAAIIDLKMVVVPGTAGTAAGIIARVMAVVQGIAETTAAIIELLMLTVPGTGAKAMSKGILALAVKINNREVRPDNLSLSSHRYLTYIIKEIHDEKNMRVVTCCCSYHARLCSHAGE